MRDIHAVTDDFRKVFERLHEMFQDWKGEYHEVFIDEVRKLDLLDKDLEEITGDKQQTHLIRVGIYRSIFPEAPKQM